MKKILALFIVILAFSCSDDEGGITSGSEFPKTTTINFEVNLTDVRDADVTTTINDVDILELSDTANFIKSYENIVVSLQTEFKLKYMDQSPTPFVPYEATLVIKDINNIVKSQNFNVTQQGQVFEIDYRFGDDN